MRNDRDFDLTEYLPGIRGTIPRWGHEELLRYHGARLKVWKNDDLNAETSDRLICEATAKLLHGKPNAKQLAALPERVLSGFVNWLNAQVEVRTAELNRRPGGKSASNKENS